MISQAKAQQRSIKGKVTDASNGDPLPGANVYIPKLNIGAATGVNGTYVISSVPTGTYTVTVTYVGYKKYTTTVEVADHNVTLNVKLQASNVGLNQVFVTAQGEKKTKNELSYSAQQVQPQSIQSVHAQNFTNLLSGKVSGLDVRPSNTMGGSTNMVLRGITSLTGNNQPLFVIDGVPFANSNTNTGAEQAGFRGYDFGNAANDLNPDNIASIDVLKGAAATALYGERGANGVIVITTKQGNKTKGIGVSLNAGVGIGYVDKSTFPKYQHEYGAGYGAYYAPPFDPTVTKSFFFNTDMTGNGKADLVVPFTEDASYGAKFNKNLTVYQWQDGKLVPKPWVAAAHGPMYFMKHAVDNHQSIFVDGTTNKGYYKIGYTRKNETGILPNSDLGKDQFNLGGSYKLTEKLKATGSVNFTKTSGLGRYGNGYDNINPMTNFRQWFETNVDLKQQQQSYFHDHNNDTWNYAGFAGQKPIFWDNQYYNRYQNYENDNRNRYYGFAKLRYDPASWVNIKGQISLDTYNWFQQQRIAYQSIDIPQYERYNRDYSEYNYKLVANFNKQLTKDLKLTGLLGGNIRKQRIHSIDQSTNGGLGVPGIYALSNSKNALTFPTEHYNRRDVDGAFAEATLVYKNMLVLDMTDRRDVSSTLPKKNDTYYYPSISGAFTFSELTKNSLPWLSYAKIHASYAEVGHDAPVYSIHNSYDTFAPFGGIALHSNPGTLNNPELKPERTKEYEVGINTEFLKNRIGFNVSYYKSNTIDQIIPAAVSRATGYNAFWVNAGNVENRGWEVSGFIRPVQTSNFVWTINANWSRNRNKVISLAPGISNLQLAVFQNGVSLNATVGQPYGTLKGTDFMYYNDNMSPKVGTGPAYRKGGEKIVNPNTGYYEKSGTSNNVIGNINPNWTGSISNTFEYKNFSLSFQVDLQNGGDIYSLDMAYGLATGLYPSTAGLNSKGKPKRSPVSQGGGVLLKGVTPTGSPNKTWAGATSFANPWGYYWNPGRAFIYDASFIKLRQVDISYSLPQRLVSNLGLVRGIDLSLVGRNLWIIQKNIPYSDPQAGTSAGNIQGFQGGAYPSVRNITFNISLKF